MRILSWNVNGIRAVEKRGFVSWVQKESPDILCLQETKARPEQLSPALRNLTDPQGQVYTSYWGSAKKPGYSGVALYSRKPPQEVKPLGIKEFDDEGRVLLGDFGDFVLITAYFPNSQDGGARLGYKLDFCQAILDQCHTLTAAGRRLILCGDYNIAHNPIDLARPKENEKNPGYLPEERAWLDRFVAAGYVDAFRALHPGETGQYSWWSYRGNARERNVGWRLDYFWVDQGFMPRIADARLRPEVLGSDHCPVQLDVDTQ